VKHALSAAGKKLHFYLNYSGQAQKFSYPYGSGLDLLTERRVEKGTSIAPGAWDLAIVEEQ
jgi:beta-galactosidase